MYNPWPDVDDVVSTKDVAPFLERMQTSIEEKYGGKLHSNFSEIKYVFEDVQHSISKMRDMTILVGSTKEESKRIEIKDIEKGRDPAFVTKRNLKFEIYNDHLFYKLFTVELSEFYPIKVFVSPGILEDDGKTLLINNFDKLENCFTEIVNSDKVKGIIKKMLL